MEAKSREYERLEYKPVTLTKFESGDNSYVEIQRHIEGAADETLLCTAPQCSTWRDSGGLPLALRNKKIEVKLGRANQLDGAGQVVNRNVVAVVDMRLPSTPASTAATSPALPLKRGVYVLAGDSCARPANASFRIWDGQGLSGSATRACRTTVRSRTGETYQISNSCVNTYDGSRSPEQTAIRVPTSTTFVQKGNSFRLCPIGEVPAELRRLLQ